MKINFENLPLFNSSLQLELDFFVFKMNLTLFSAFALFAFVSDATAQFGPAGAGISNPFMPPAAASGWLIGQESSKNAVDVAVNSAISKVNVTELPPELQVYLIST